jgi:hypothetical protein
MIVKKIIDKKETDYERIKRKREEKKTLEKENQKENQINITNEKKRVEKIITPYLKSLDEQLSEKQLFSFWVFPDRKGFKKINGISYDIMQNMIKENIKKYSDRYIAYFSICSYHDSPKNSTYRKLGVWLIVDITIYHIDNDGNLKNKKDPSWGCGVRWEDEDFKISKLSFQLLEELMRVTATKKYTNASLGGFRLKKVINDIKKKGIDFSHILSPLSGV